MWEGSRAGGLIDFRRPRKMESMELGGACGFAGLGLGGSGAAASELPALLYLGVWGLYPKP